MKLGAAVESHNKGLPKYKESYVRGGGEKKPGHLLKLVASGNSWLADRAHVFREKNSKDAVHCDENNGRSAVTGRCSIDLEEIFNLVKSSFVTPDQAHAEIEDFLTRKAESERLARDAKAAEANKPKPAIFAPAAAAPAKGPAPVGASALDTKTPSAASASGSSSGAAAAAAGGSTVTYMNLGGEVSRVEGVVKRIQRGSDGKLYIAMFEDVNGTETILHRELAVETK